MARDVAFCPKCGLRLPGELSHGAPCSCRDDKAKHRRIMVEEATKLGMRGMVLSELEKLDKLVIHGAWRSPEGISVAWASGVDTLTDWAASAYDVVVMLNPDTTRIHVYCIKAPWERSFKEAIHALAAAKEDEYGKRWLIHEREALSQEGMSIGVAGNVATFLYRLAVC